MPLLDHFHPPVSARKAWEGFHGMWASCIVQQLNTGVLPEPFEAEPQITLNSRIEVDVATLEPEEYGYERLHDSDGGVATLPKTYVAPAPTLSSEVAFGEPDSFEVLIYREAERWRLAAAIEIVSPSNKNRPESRSAFARKCAAYLAAGASVVVLDLVTIRTANLHREFLSACDLPDGLDWQSSTGLSAITYRATRHAKTDRVRMDVWPHALMLGGALPTVPLCLASDLAVPLDLESTYHAACKSLRLAS